MAPCIIDPPAFIRAKPLIAAIVGNLQKHLPEYNFAGSSYSYEFTSNLGVQSVALVTIILAGIEAFVIVTDPDNPIGPGVSANFAAIASGLKAVDPSLIELPEKNIHWIEYRGPGSYLRETRSTFLLVVMKFNPLIACFARASWGHIFKLADVVLGQTMEKGAHHAAI